jgi:hypothetical protein
MSASLRQGLIGAVVVLAGAARIYRAFRRRRRMVARLDAVPASERERRRREFVAQSAWQRAWRGMRVTLIVPGAFTILIVAMYVIGGRHQLSRGTDTDFLVLSIAYPLGSAIMGAVIGLGAPFMRGFVRSALVGIAAIAPFVFGIMLAVDNGLQHLDEMHMVVGTGMTVLYGSAIGYGVGRARRQLADRAAIAGSASAPAE